MKTLLPSLLLLTLLPTLISANRISNGHVFAALLQPQAKTDWGEWGNWQFCPRGAFVNRFQLKVEDKQGAGDDTGLNGVRMFCSSGDFRGNFDIVSAAGKWGTWRAPVHCNRFYTGIQFRSEPKQGAVKDDTAGNNVRMLCHNVWHDGGGLNWGEWTAPQYCPARSAICGLRTKVETPQGDGDDTGLNAIEVQCCYL